MLEAPALHFLGCPKFLRLEEGGGEGGTVSDSILVEHKTTFLTNSL